MNQILDEKDIRLREKNEDVIFPLSNEEQKMIYFLILIRIF